MTDLDRLRPQLERALRYDPEWTFAAIEEELAAGRMQLWPGRDSVVLTEILVRPKGRVLYFFLAAGNMAEVRALYPTIIAWGEAQGCIRASFVGRYGWARTFLTREEGWSSKLALYEKELRPHG